MIYLLALIIAIWLLDLYHDGITPGLEELEGEDGGWASIEAALWVMSW